MESIRNEFGRAVKVFVNASQSNGKEQLQCPRKFNISNFGMIEFQYVAKDQTSVEIEYVIKSPKKTLQSAITVLRGSDILFVALNHIMKTCEN